MFPPLEIGADDGPSRHPVADWCSCRVAEGPPHRATYVASPRQKKAQNRWRLKIVQTREILHNHIPPGLRRMSELPGSHLVTDLMRDLPLDHVLLPLHQPYRT